MVWTSSTVHGIALRICGDSGCYHCGDPESNRALTLFSPAFGRTMPNRDKFDGPNRTNAVYFHVSSPSPLTFDHTYSEDIVGAHLLIGWNVYAPGGQKTLEICDWTARQRWQSSDQAAASNPSCRGVPVSPCCCLELMALRLIEMNDCPNAGPGK
jgi:hypothetical protein